MGNLETLVQDTPLPPLPTRLRPEIGTSRGCICVEDWCVDTTAVFLDDTVIPSRSLFPTSAHAIHAGSVLIRCYREKFDCHEIWIKFWLISQIRDALNTEWPCCWDVIVVDSSVELGYAIWYVPDNHLDITIRSNAGYSRRILVSKDNYDYMTIFYNRDSNNLRAIQSNPVG